jgi:ATP-dependent Lhr-like helicase
VRNVPDDLKCKNCSAKIIGFIPAKDKDLARKVVAKSLKDMKLSSDEAVLYKNLSESAELFLNYGKKACFVLAGYGVGPSTAKRILKRYDKDDKQLLMDIVEAERTFASNKQFWQKPS